MYSERHKPPDIATIPATAKDSKYVVREDGETLSESTNSTPYEILQHIVTKHIKTPNFFPHFPSLGDNFGGLLILLRFLPRMEIN